MAKSPADPERKAVPDSLLLGMPGVTGGTMFDCPGYFVGGKLFAVLYGDGVGIKVPAHIVDRLMNQTDIVPFQPYGRAKMREWVQINHANPTEYRKDLDILHASMGYVAQLLSTERKKV